MIFWTIVFGRFQIKMIFFRFYDYHSIGESLMEAEWRLRFAYIFTICIVRVYLLF